MNQYSYKSNICLICCSSSLNIQQVSETGVNVDERREYARQFLSDFQSACWESLRRLLEVPSITHVSLTDIPFGSAEGGEMRTRDEEAQDGGACDDDDVILTCPGSSVTEYLIDEEY